MEALTHIGAPSAVATGSRTATRATAAEAGEGHFGMVHGQGVASPNLGTPAPPLYLAAAPHTALSDGDGHGLGAVDTAARQVAPLTGIVMVAPTAGYIVATITGPFAGL